MFDEPSDVDYALGRLPDRTYLHASFRLRLATSRDYGQWARYVVRVFDEPPEWIERDDTSSDLEWTEELMPATPGGRVQVKFQVARRAGEIRQIEIDQVGTWGEEPRMVRLLRLDREGARRFMELVETVKHASVEGGETTERIDDEALRAFFADPGAVVQLYERDRERFRELIRSDASAEDVVALAHRRKVVERFRELLTDAEAFEEARAATARGGPEDVWQEFLEANPWVLGVSLAGQLLTSWDPEKLERVVVGSSVTGPGKRVDFELYRRNLQEPEIVTYDELLARAEWHVELAEQEDSVASS